MKIVFVCDFFAEHVNGGGELNNEELINVLLSRKHSVEKKQSHLITEKYLATRKKCLFIIGNFINLSPYLRSKIAQDFQYIIYEHDHKYLLSRDPAKYKDFVAPPTDIINYRFYKNAKAVVCQSSFHENIMKKNLEIDNTVNVSGNLWSIEQFEYLKSFTKKKKNKKCSIMNSSIGHKNTARTVQYCNSKNKDFDLIQNLPPIDFLDKLSNNETFVFFPETPETLSRVVLEARMTGMSVITNNMVGATYENWFKMKGEELIEHLQGKREEIPNKIEEIFSKKKRFQPLKEISILTTFHKGEPLLENFLEDITQQTIFDKCELIIIDANSPGREKEIVEKYKEKYDNITYHRLDHNVPITECLNMAIKMSNSEYLTLGNIDDRRRKDCLEVLLANIKSSNVGLVYGDVYQTAETNETYENNSSPHRLLEHSRFSFSKENMVKCLPGPIPLWKRIIHERCGFFDSENHNYADDWDMWLRAVDAGFVFKKVDEIVGLYYVGGRSQQQSNIKQRKEEAKIFFKYGHIFGNRFNEFRGYFQQFLR